MARSDLGTTSSAEAESVPRRWMHAKGILVTTEVRRETVRDPNFPSMGDVSCLGIDASISAGSGHGEEDVPSLDELPLPDSFGILS